MRIDNIKTCTALSSRFEPINQKKSFSNIDKSIYIWFQIYDLEQDIDVLIDLFSPNGSRLLQISIPVKSTTLSRNFRNVWAVFDINLFLIVKEYGEWTTYIKKEDEILGQYCFKYSNNISMYSEVTSHSLILDKKI